MGRKFQVILILSFCALIRFRFVIGTPRYYGTQLPYGSGDTIINVFNAHGGSNEPHRKWIVECQDGEAMVGLQDFNEDYSKISAIWCTFTFPNKPPTNGLYPYYPRCHVRDYVLEFYCFDNQRPNVTMNTFMTGLWDNEFQFYVNSYGFRGDLHQYYKCCRTPNGYYIDYVSCYYMPTHDHFFEYYDASNWFLVKCSTGYVMTGISRKADPYKPNEPHVEWIQCCRVGFGYPRENHPPPVIHSQTGRPTYFARGLMPPPQVPRAYLSQYQKPREFSCSRNTTEEDGTCESRFSDNLHLRYENKPVPYPKSTEHNFPNSEPSSNLINARLNRFS